MVTMRVEPLSKSRLLRYEGGSVLLFARNAYASKEALLMEVGINQVRGGGAACSGIRQANRGKLINPDRSPLLYLRAKKRYAAVRSKQAPTARMP
jgi:hypothetical protein